MAENKKGFVLYADLLTVVKKLVEQDRENRTNYAGELFLLILEYVNDLNPVPINFIVDMAFEPIKLQLKRDLKKYEVKKEQWSNAGKKSAEKRSTKSTDVNGRSTDSTVIVKDKVTDTVKDTVNVKDINLLFPSFSDKFLESWKLLLTQKKWKKKSSAALQASLNKLGKHSEAAAIQMIENTIAGEWQGIFELKQTEQKGSVEQKVNAHEIVKQRILGKAS